MNKYDGDVYGMGADGGGAATGGGYPAAKAGRGAGGGDAGGLGANWERRDQLNSTAQGMKCHWVIPACKVAFKPGSNA